MFEEDECKGLTLMVKERGLRKASTEKLEPSG